MTFRQSALKVYEIAILLLSASLPKLLWDLQRRYHGVSTGFSVRYMPMTELRRQGASVATARAAKVGVHASRASEIFTSVVERNWYCPNSRYLQFTPKNGKTREDYM